MSTSLSEYYKKPLRRRVLHHGIPMSIALFLGAVAILSLDRNSPVTVSWGKVIPPEVLAGQPVKFHYGSIRHHDYGGTIKRWIVDQHGHFFNLSDTGVFGDKLSLNVEGEVVKDFVVPCGMSLGPATYHSDAALYGKWNFVQWLFPIHRELQYPFIVRAGVYKDVCAGHAAPQDTQGIQGIQGVPGVAVPRPRIINKVWIEPTTIAPGGKFTIHIDVTINQICPGETHWSLVRTSDGVEIMRIVQSTVPTKIGRNLLQNTRTVPPTVQPGEYYYTATVYEFCGPERTTFVAATEHIPFTVK